LTALQPVLSSSSSPAGGVAKSHNSSQLNLSGSSSSLTSDASTKAGTASLRSYGIGGALLHKRFLLMTRHHSAGQTHEQRDQTVTRMQMEKGSSSQERATGFRGAGEETVATPGDLISARRRRGQSADGDPGAGAGLPAQRRTCFPLLTAPDTGLCVSGLRSVMPSSVPQGQLTPSSPGIESDSLRSGKPPESLFRRRLKSPFRAMRDRSGRSGCLGSRH